MLPTRWGPYRVGFQDLSFDRALAPCLRPSGAVNLGWVPVGMPRIDHEWVKTVFYLFRRNPKTGEIDEGPQGTGFFVLRPSTELSGLSHFYAVSNWHVTHDLGASIIRVNSPYDDHRFIELDPSEWTFERDGDDLSVIDVTESVADTFQSYWYVDERAFIGRQKYDELMIDVAEDTMMIGLFAGHHGGDTNIPSVRFGNISMLPSEKAPVKQPNHVLRPSYLVDTRSRGGYSGSPVFVYRTPDGDIRRARRSLPLRQIENVLFGLLGVHCAQFSETVRVRKATKGEAIGEVAGEAVGDPIREGDALRIEGGMTIVVPAWRISDLLDRPEFKMRRKDRDEKRRASWEKLPVPEAEGESASPPASDENSNHQEDFKRLLGEAARKRSAHRHVG